MKRQSFWPTAIFLLLGLTTHLSLYDLAIAQQQSAGVVTGIQGQAQLTRPAVAPSALKFKDGVVIRDVVDTREKSLARILFGGKSTVTVRELSRLEVREELLPGGARRDVHDLSSGAILVNVARQLMRPGDEVVIRTPNAVAAIRGSTVFSSFNAILNQSFFAILSGSGTVTPQGLPPVNLSANTPNNGANVSGSGPGIQVNIINVPPAQANQIIAESNVGKVVKEEAGKEQNVQAAVKEAAALANTVIETITKTEQAGGTTQEGGETQDSTTTDTTSETTTTAPVTPDTSSSTSSGCGSSGNIVNNCGFETTGSIPSWDSTGAAAIVTSMKDSSGNVVFKPTEKSHMAIIHTGSGAVSSTTSTLSQTNTTLQSGKTYLITFDYLFMSNEYPTQLTTFNDTFTAKGIGLGGEGGDVTIATESRNSSSFKTDKGAITSNGSTDTSFSNFTLSSGNGYVNCSGSCATDDSGAVTAFKTASKTVQPDTTSGTLEFKIIDVGDTSVDSGVLIDNVVVKLDPPLYEVFNGQSFTGPSGKPLVEFSNETTTFDSVLVSSGSGPSDNPAINLSGPVLKAENSNLTVPFSLLGLLDGRELISSSSDALISLNGGSYSLSTEKGTAIFDFWGSKTGVDPETGAAVGSGKTVTHAGALLEATGGATVDTQKVLKLDTALLEATAPIISLLGTETAQTRLTTQQSTIDLMKAKVTSNGPVVAMDKSFINVTNGALINLTYGSNMKVIGDLISMLTGSKINVVNGPLISVAGAGSLLDVSGALVNFGGSGGNKIIVNNSIAPTATLSGLPVSATYGGSINISNPIKNPNLGSISVNGSLISAANGGSVKIQGK